MSRALFVSDIHISSVDDPKYALLLRLLSACVEKRVSDLFLVGDIFDLWISDRNYFIQTYAALIEKIRELRHRGVHIHYFEGNHDLDLRPFWQHKLDVDVHSEAAFFSFAKLKLRVEHGDEMDPDDRGYLFLRWLLRTPILIILMRFLPDPLVRWIGRRASLASRDYTTQIKTASDEMARQKIRRHAEAKHAQAPFDLLISGHVHVLEDAWCGDEMARFRCVNLGTWLKQPMVFDLRADIGKLCSVEDFLTSP